MKKELKTLKDITKYLPHYEAEDMIKDNIGIWIYINDLKQEAIKWVNFLIDRELRGVELERNEKNIKWLIETNSADIRFWMDRFNLIEEELKNGEKENNNGS